MKISGFTFVKNGILLDYPFLESIQSILPICDEFIVVVGDCQDETRQRIASLKDPRIKIIDTVWDPNLKSGGEVLAQQTNIAKQHISGDWGFYIQADEVVHEKYLAEIRKAAFENLNNPKIDGLLFGFRHFYGSYNYYGLSRDWYRHEIRIVRNRQEIFSYKDAQGFRKAGNKKLKVKLIEAEIFHYGWVRSPISQFTKKKLVSPLWGEEDIANDKTTFRYNRRERLDVFKETHPGVMSERVKNMDWKFPYDPAKIKIPLKEKLSIWVENKLGVRIAEYKNYRLS